MSHYVYAIGRSNGPIKIGVTSNLVSRLAGIQTGCFFHAELIFFVSVSKRQHALEIEKSFHSDYSSLRLSGEWFGIPFKEASSHLQFLFECDQYAEFEMQRRGIK